MFNKSKPNPKTCEFCPHKFDAGCPMWIDNSWGIVETNIVSGETRLLEGCFYPNMLRISAHVIQASNRPAAAIESTRNEIVNGFARVANVLLDSAVHRIENSPNDPKRIEKI